MGFEAEPVGAMLVQFEDGSAIVKGDGSADERDALLALLRDGGSDEGAAEGIARALLSQGLTLTTQEPLTGDLRVMGGATFSAIAEALGPRTERRSNG